MKRRIPIVMVLVLAIAALLIADRAITRDTPRDPVATTALMPLASPPGAVSSAFFCAGGGAKGGVYDSTLVIGNPRPSPATVLVTTYPATSPGDASGLAAVAALKPAVKNVTIGPRGRSEVRLADIQQSPFAAAVIETNDPDVAVERRVTNAAGTLVSSSACASSPSDHWYFPTGTTTRDAYEFYAVFNPFPVDAVIDVSLQTSDGFRQPSDLQSLPVPGGQMRLLELSTSVPRIEQLAGTVVSRSGRVIVDRLQYFDGSDPAHPAGVAVTLGAPASAPVWTFGEGQVVEGVNEDYTIMNPSNATVQAQVEVTLDDPATNGVVDPIPVSIPARSYAQVQMRAETRVPQDIGHSVVVRALGGAEVVAERVVKAAAPAPRRGYAPALGSPLVATNWLFPDGRAIAGNMAEFLIAVNPTANTARVKMTAITQGQLLAIEGLQEIEVPSGGRVAVELGQHVNRSDLMVMVESDQPIVVERGLYATEQRGISLSLGIPLSEDVSVPDAHPRATTTTVEGLPPASG